MIRKYTKVEAFKEFKKFIKKNNKNEALKIGKALLKKQINLEVLNLLTELYMDLHKVDQGIKFYEEVDNLFDENIDIKKNLIKLKNIHFKDYKYVELKINEILKKNPEDLETINTKLKLHRITNKKMKQLNTLMKLKKIKK